MHIVPSKDNHLSAYNGSYKNNFDLLRFIFASIVMLVHANALTGKEELSVFSSLFSSEMAVKGFFLISGFLIFMSYENSTSLTSYFKKRIKRIYPAYLTVITLCVLFGLIYNYINHTFTSALTGIMKYYVANLTFLNFVNPVIPNLLNNNPINAVNGALWTLKIEVMFYLFVPIVVFLFHKLGRKYTFLVLYLGSLFYTYLALNLANTTGNSSYLEIQRQLPGQLTYFLVGATAYYYFSSFKKYLFYLMSFSVLCYLFKTQIININAWHIFEPIVLGVMVIYCATLLPYLGGFAKYGDFSYGVYILHFPIIQALIALGAFKSNAFVGLFLAISLSLLSAFLLWHLVEKKFLINRNR